MFHQFRREMRATQEHAEATSTLRQSRISILAGAGFAPVWLGAHAPRTGEGRIEQRPKAVEPSVPQGAETFNRML